MIMHCEFIFQTLLESLEYINTAIEPPEVVKTVMVTYMLLQFEPSSELIYFV